MDQFQIFLLENVCPDKNCRTLNLNQITGFANIPNFVQLFSLPITSAKVYRHESFFLQKLHHNEDSRLLDFGANQISGFENMNNFVHFCILWFKKYLIKTA
jgi:hypothetical protein